TEVLRAAPTSTRGPRASRAVWSGIGAAVVTGSAAIVLLVGAATVWWQMQRRSGRTAIVEKVSQSQPAASRGLPLPPATKSQSNTEKAPVASRRVDAKVNATTLPATSSVPPADADPARMRATAAGLAQALVDGKFDDARAIKDDWTSLSARMGGVRWHSAP